MFYRLFLVLIKSKPVKYEMISLYDLGSSESKRQICRLYMILYKMRHRMYTSVNSSAKLILITEVLSSRLFLILGYMYGVSYKLIHTLVFCRRYRHNRGSKHCLHPIYIYGARITCDLIHHVECDDNRYLHLKKLHCEIHISLYISSVYYIDDSLWVIIKHKVSGHDLLAAIRRHRIYSRQIRHGSILPAPYRTIFSVDSYSREIAYMLI